MEEKSLEQRDFAAAGPRPAAWSRYAWFALPRRHPVWTAIFSILLAAAAALVIFDWNWARRPLEQIVSSHTGREFRIEGDLDVDFFPLEVSAEKLRLANVRWSDADTMARADRVDMRIRFWPLLAGRVILADLELDHPYLRLERNAKGQGNWQFDAKTDPASRDDAKEPGDCAAGNCGRLRIQQLRASEGIFEFREPSLQTSIDLRFDSARPAGDDALAPLKFSGKGSYRNSPFELGGHVDSPLALQGKAQPYRVDISARAGATQARVSGTLAEPLQTRDVSLNFGIRGPDLARLYEFTGIVLPGTPPYALEGRLSRQGAKFSYRKFSGTVGDSDLSGDATVDIGGDRPKLTAVLQSKLLDFDDLAGFIGGVPGTGEGETASSEQQEAASLQKASGKVLPSTPIQTEKLRAMDADVRFAAARVDSPRLPLENMTAHLSLVDGELTIDPLVFGAAGGKLASVVRVDARQEPAKFALDMQIGQLDLPKLFPTAKALQESIGSINGVVSLEGQGSSAASVLASSNGNVSAIMGEGRISILILELAGLDIAEALAVLIDDENRQVTLRCAYADFEVVDGIATARSVALDTTDTALLLRGDLSLRDESLDLRLLPRPKDSSPLAVRTPIRIGGTFADPSIAPEAGPLLLRGAAVAALAAIAPPLALLGLIETGPGKDLDCGGAPAGEGKPARKKRSAAIS